MILLIILFIVAYILFVDVIDNRNESNRNYLYVAISLLGGYLFLMIIFGTNVTLNLKTYTYRVERYQELKEANNVNDTQLKKLRNKIIDEDDLNSYKIKNENQFLYNVFIPDNELEKALKARKKFENIKVQKK